MTKGNNNALISKTKDFNTKERKFINKLFKQQNVSEKLRTFIKI